MESTIISFRKIVLISFLSGFLFLIYFFVNFFNQETRVVFCNVGQGDAAYIRVKNQYDILIDAGPDKKVLGCLGKHIPFYDKKIELIILSHPQKDHFGGLWEIINRYQIGKILMPALDNQNSLFKKLKQKISQKKIKTDFPTAQDKINIGQNHLTFFWPTKKFLSQNLVFEKKYSLINNQYINQINNQVLGISHLEDNNFSLVFLYQEKNIKILFTGDASSLVLNSLASEKNNCSLLVDVLKIPHHGSKNGLTENFLKLTCPKLAVISVGIKNPFNHPHGQILKMLKNYKIKIKRTDLDGDIVFKIKN
ncbi:MAG: MBL fold metallo-hydrolase [Patescibacteria group bacterium]|nr:MBL fold metallo-hydrolase [Patescibacteria group bacterium]